MSRSERKRLQLSLLRVIEEDEKLHASQHAADSDEADAPVAATSAAAEELQRVVRAHKQAGKARDVAVQQRSTAAASNKPPQRRQRVLVFCSRGIIERYRHLMQDIKKLLPHHKTDVKMDSKDGLDVINEICEMKSCNKVLYFECRKKKDLYMWVGNVPHGPSAKFHVVNVHTMDELKLTGNALLGSRSILHFDKAFDVEPELQLLKELFAQVFNVPRYHKKSKPFIDRILGFFVADGKIWCRHYQILWPSRDNTLREKKLVEIGPRFVLIPIRIFAGSFGGETLYQNKDYQSPNELRRLQKLSRDTPLSEKRERVAKQTELKEKFLKKRPIDQLSGHHVFKADAATDDLTGISKMPKKKRRKNAPKQEEQEESSSDQQQDDNDDEDEDDEDTGGQFEESSFEEDDADDESFE